MSSDTPISVNFENSQPILRVENMKASIHFYVDQLGFQNADWGSDDFTCVSRGGAVMYLCRGDQGRGGAWIWIGVEDAKSSTKSWSPAACLSACRPRTVPGRSSSRLKTPTVM